MSVELNEKQKRVRYIRLLEKFLTRTLSILKQENFEKEMFIKRTNKNLEDLSRVSSVELYSDYYIRLGEFLSKTKAFLGNSSDSFEEERATLLKDANLIQKEKNKSRYKKDKHKNKSFDDGY